MAVHRLIHSVWSIGSDSQAAGYGGPGIRPAAARGWTGLIRPGGTSPAARRQQRDLNLRPLLDRVALHLHMTVAADECQGRLQLWSSHPAAHWLQGIVIPPNRCGKPGPQLRSRSPKPPHRVAGLSGGSAAVVGAAIGIDPGNAVAVGAELGRQPPAAAGGVGQAGGEAGAAVTGA